MNSIGKQGEVKSFCFSIINLNITYMPKFPTFPNYEVEGYVRTSYIEK